MVEEARIRGRGYVYILECDIGQRVAIKIGFTARPITQRLAEWVGVFDFRFVRAIYSESAHSLETYLKRRFRDRAVGGRWAEVFWLEETDLTYIENMDEFDGQAVTHFTDMIEANTHAFTGIALCR